MDRERKLKNVIIVALLVVVVSLSVAFAATLSSELTVTGTAKIADANWDVKFTEANLTNASNLDGAPAPTVTNNTVTYTITLEEGKTYAFDAIIENNGTYDAEVSKITVAGAEGYEDVLTYTATGLAVGDTISKKTDGTPGTDTLSVSVYMKPITNDNVGILSGGKELTLTVIVEFVQA